MSAEAHRVKLVERFGQRGELDMVSVLVQHSRDMAVVFARTLLQLLESRSGSG